MGTLAAVVPRFSPCRSEASAIRSTTPIGSARVSTTGFVVSRISEMAPPEVAAAAKGGGAAVSTVTRRLIVGGVELPESEREMLLVALC
jgi:hypothetical protein